MNLAKINEVKLRDSQQEAHDARNHIRSAAFHALLRSQLLLKTSGGEQKGGEGAMGLRDSSKFCYFIWILCSDWWFERVDFLDGTCAGGRACLPRPQP